MNFRYSISEIQKLLVVSAILVLILWNCYVFFHPYNTIADEEEYLGEAFSLANGSPAGWDIRSFVPQILLAVIPYILSSIGVDDPQAMTTAVRTVNWLYWWLGAALVYLIAARASGKKMAILALALLLANSVWMFNSRRVMMDVPSAVWMLAAIYLLGDDKWNYRHAVLIPVTLGMASATKFQMGPLSVIMMGFFLLGLIRSRKFKQLRTSLIVSVGFVVLFGLVDKIVYGSWFKSLFSFYTYTFINTENFSETYGNCEGAAFYLIESRNIFSYILPLFIIIGFFAMIRSYKNRQVLTILIATCSYALLIQNVCHKQVRYLIAVLPLLILIGSFGIIYSTTYVIQLRKKPIPGFIGNIATFGLVAVITTSMISRSEVKEMFSIRQSCSSFVYEDVAPKALREGINTLVLAVPCGMPPHYLLPIKTIYGGIGFNEETRKKQIDEYRAALATASGAVVKRGDLMEEIVKEEWKALDTANLQSTQNEYVFYFKPSEKRSSR